MKRVCPWSDYDPCDNRDDWSRSEVCYVVEPANVPPGCESMFVGLRSNDRDEAIGLAVEAVRAIVAGELVDCRARVVTVAYGSAKLDGGANVIGSPGMPVVVAELTGRAALIWRASVVPFDWTRP